MIKMNVDVVRYPGWLPKPDDTIYQGQVIGLYSVSGVIKAKLFLDDEAVNPIGLALENTVAVAGGSTSVGQGGDYTNYNRGGLLSVASLGVWEVSNDTVAAGVGNIYDTANVPLVGKTVFAISAGKMSKTQAATAYPIGVALNSPADASASLILKLTI